MVIEQNLKRETEKENIYPKLQHKNPFLPSLFSLFFLSSFFYVITSSFIANDLTIYIIKERTSEEQAARI